MTEEEFLASYNPKDYDRPSVTVDMLLFAMNKDLSSLRVLLIKRKGHPYKDCWALAGGFVNMKESAYEAACRELKEETGIENVYLEQLYTLSQPDRDPRMRVISIAYMALVNEMPVIAGDDAEDALWFDLSVDGSRMKLKNSEQGICIEYKLKKKAFINGVVKVKNYIPSDAVSSETLAFDHAEIILEGFMRLRNKVEYSDIAFNLLPKEFTLPDLQRVYEIILGKELYKTNFKSKLVGKIEPLGIKGASIVGHKKSELYKYKI